MRAEKKMKGILLVATIAVAAKSASSAGFTLATSTAEGGIEIREEDVHRARPPPPVTIQRRRQQRQRRRQLVDNRPETGTARADEEERTNHRKHHPKTNSLEQPTASGANTLSKIPPVDESTTVMSMSMSSSYQQHERNEDNSGSKSGKSKSNKSPKKAKKEQHINNDHITTSSPSSSSNGISSSTNPTCTSPTDSNCIVPVPVPVPIPTIDTIDGSTSSPGMISSTSSPNDDDGIIGGGFTPSSPAPVPVPSTSTSTTTTVPHPSTSTSYPSSYKSPTSTTTSTSTTNATTTLTWKGVNGCTSLTPCPPCTGDCDTDADCTSGAFIATSSEGGKGGGGTVGVTQYTGACYKRSDGSTEQIPGCSVGGAEDIPGADYCYAKVMLDLSYYHPPDDGVDGGDGNGGTLPTTTTTTTTPSTTSTDNNSPSPPTMTSLSPASVNVDEKVSPRPSIKNENNDGPYCFIQSHIEGGSTSYGGYCIGGALSPDYYQLQMEECTTIDNNYYTNKTVAGTTGINGLSWDDAYIVTRLEQMDQLWNMDTMGYIHSAFDYDRCMTVPITSIIEQQEQQQQQQNNNVVVGDSGGLIAKESPVEIGPCTSSTDRLSRFIYPKNANEFMYGAVPKLRLRGFENYCVTFLGMIPKGAPVVLGICPESVTITGQDEDGSYGWDFVSEHNLGVDSETGTTVAPTSVPLPLRYLGRDACNPITPCHECMGDCDTDDDCSSGLKCFERERDEYTKVPGCGTGGPGDIPGADYCYDSTPDNSDAGDNGPDPSTLPLLRWLGSEGCSQSRPCGACSGDCDEDDDCLDRHECFKRYVGETTSVPGCDAGGSGDIPGGDYCYDIGALVTTTGSSSSSSSSSSPLDDTESTPTPKTQPPRPAPSAPFNAIVNGMNTQATGGDGTVIDERIRQPVLTRHNIMHDSAKTHKEKEDEQ